MREIGYHDVKGMKKFGITKFKTVTIRTFLSRAYYPAQTFSTEDAFAFTFSLRHIHTLLLSSAMSKPKSIFNYFSIFNPLWDKNFAQKNVFSTFKYLCFDSTFNLFVTKCFFSCTVDNCKIEKNQVSLKKLCPII